MMTCKPLWSAAAVLLLLPTMAPAQEVFKQITSQRLEDILRSMNIQFSKGDNAKGATWYDYKSKNETLRLTNFSGKDLMIDIYLTKVDWEKINKWNSDAKFSRARLEKNAKGEAAVIESNLDLAGGVTEDTIKHFIRNFDLEVARWLNKPVAPVVDPNEGTYTNVSADRLEKILGNMNIQFKKTLGKGNANIFYDFDRNNFKLRLISYGGNDLMVDCLFPQAPLAKINDWNKKRAYVRAVLYEGGGKPYTALESNLDCVGGTNDSIIRYFIESFDGEVKAFDEHLKR